MKRGAFHARGPRNEPKEGAGDRGRDAGVHRAQRHRLPGGGAGRNGPAGRDRVLRALRRRRSADPADPVHGAVQGRRVRRPLLPAPGLQQLRPRGRRGEPRVRQRRARGGRPRRARRPDRVRVHGGPHPRGAAGGRAHRGRHRRRARPRGPAALPRRLRPALALPGEDALGGRAPGAEAAHPERGQPARLQVRSPGAQGQHRLLGPGQRDPHRGQQRAPGRGRAADDQPVRLLRGGAERQARVRAGTTWPPAATSATTAPIASAAW